MVHHTFICLYGLKVRQSLVKIQMKMLSTPHPGMFVDLLMTLPHVEEFTCSSRVECNKFFHGPNFSQFLKN